MKRIKRLTLFLACLLALVCTSPPSNHLLIGEPSPPPPLPDSPSEYWQGLDGKSLESTTGLPLKNADVRVDAEVVSLTSDVEIGRLNVGTAKAATVSHTAGVNSLLALCLGGKDGSEGTYNLSGEALLAAGTECIGYKGAGTFNQAGGVNTTQKALLGAVDKPSIYNILSGLFTAGSLRIGYTDKDNAVYQAVFNQKGGSVSVGGYGKRLLLGQGKATGVYNLEGGDLAAAELFVGVKCEDTGKAIFNQKGGINRASRIQVSCNGNGASYNLEGGELDAQEIIIGRDAWDDNRGKHGEFAQAGGICFVGRLALFGDGIYNMRGGILVVGSLWIEDKGSLDIALGKVASLKFVGDQHNGIDNYIKQGRIFDSTSKGKGRLRALFNPFTKWTTIVITDAEDTAKALMYIDPQSAFRLSKHNPLYVHTAAVLEAHGKALESSRHVEKDARKIPGFGVPSTKRLEDFLEKMEDFTPPDKPAGRPLLYYRSCLLGKTGAQSFEQANDLCSYNNLIAGVGPKSDARYDAKSHTLNVSNSVVLGWYGKGETLLGRGRFANSLILGVYPGSHGTCGPSQSAKDHGTDVSVTNSLYAGYGGDGECNGGYRITNILFLGFLPGATGKFTAGGLDIENPVFVGYGGKGELVMTNCSNTAPLYVGFYPDSEGTVIQKEACSLDGMPVFIGYGGRGEYTMEHGSFLHGPDPIGLPPDLYLGYLPASSGTYNFADGHLGRAASEMNVGPTLDPGEPWSRDNSKIFIGCAGKGIFNQTGGSARAWQVYLGLLPGSRGVYNLNDGNILVGDSIYVGNLGEGEFNQAGGSIKVFGDLYVGAVSDAGAVYNMKGGSLQVEGTVKIGGGGGKPEFNQTGGKVLMSARGDGLVILNGSKYTFQSGELFLAKLQIEDGGTLGIDPGKATFHMHGGKELLNKYIAEGKIYNCSAGAKKNDLVVVETAPNVDGSRYFTLMSKKDAAVKAPGGKIKP